MKMTAKMFADQLADQLIEARNIEKLGSEYTGVRFLVPGTTHLEPGYAYVLTDFDLCNLADCNDCLLIVAGLAADVDAWPVLACSGSLTEVYDAALKAHEHCNALEHDLGQGVLEGREIDFFLKTCADFFRCTTQLLDPAFNIVAGFQPLYEQGVLTGFKPFDSDFTPGMVSELSRLNMLKQANEFVTAHYFKTPLFPSGAIHANIFEGGTYSGKLLLIEGERPFAPGVTDTVDRISKFFHHLLTRRKATMDIGLFTTEYFLSEILAGRINDAGFIESQLECVGWSLQDEYQIACVSVMAREAIDFYIQSLRKRLTGALIFPTDEYLVAVMRNNGGRGDIQQKRLGEFLKDGQLQAGLSEVFHDFTEAKAFFIQARHALKLSSLESPRPLICHYSNVALAHAVSAMVDLHYDRAVLHPSYLAIRDYDRNNGTDYLETLKVFLDCGTSQTETAARLHIHRNSLKYRLARLKEIAGRELDVGDDMLRIQLSFRISDFLSRSRH